MMGNIQGRGSHASKPTVIDLFCGAGGLSCGFRQAGFSVVAALDNWEEALVTYRHNFPDTKTINADIEKITPQEIGVDKADVIIGGPPCQGFSVSGKRLMDDPRNKLYKAFVSLVAHYKPKLFVMENVPGVMRLFNGKVKEQIIADFSAAGYNVETKLLSAENYGIPQQRKRVFFVGINPEKIKNTVSFEFPAATHGAEHDLIPFVTVKDAISDLDFIPDDKKLDECIDYGLPAVNDYQKLMRKKSKKLYNHVAVIHGAIIFPVYLRGEVSPLAPALSPQAGLGAFATPLCGGHPRNAPVCLADLQARLNLPRKNNRIRQNNQMHNR